MESFVCGECGKKFIKTKSLNYHKVWHKDASRIENLRKKMLESNPAKLHNIREKITKSLIMRHQSSWNKGKKWSRALPHDVIVEKSVQDFIYEGYRVLTTHGYVPDAILVDFKNKTISALEINPGSVINKEERAKKKGYDILFVRDFKNARNMERKISSQKTE